MKKLAPIAVFISLLFPAAAFAQTTDNSALIAVLYKLVAVLEAEIQQILAAKAVVAPEILLATTTQGTITPLFGSATVTQSPTPSTPKATIVVQSKPMGISIDGWDGKSPIVSNDGKAVTFNVTDTSGNPASSTPITIKEGNRTIVYLGLETSTDELGQLSFLPIEIGSGSHDLVVSVPSLNLSVPMTFLITYPQE